nr:hypothetical protein CFP56_49749 [Quercus suber]
MQRGVALSSVATLWIVAGVVTLSATPGSSSVRCDAERDAWIVAGASRRLDCVAFVSYVSRRCMRRLDRRRCVATLGLSPMRRDAERDIWIVAGVATPGSCRLYVAGVATPSSSLMNRQ